MGGVLANDLGSVWVRESREKKERTGHQVCRRSQRFVEREVTKTIVKINKIATFSYSAEIPIATKLNEKAKIFGAKANKKAARDLHGRGGVWERF